MNDLVFADDPATFFGRDSFAAHRIDRPTLERLQLAGIRHRFDALKGRMKALDIMVHETGLREIGSFADALQLFLPHAIYKSYPEQYLVQGRFDLMTAWLQAFTTCDLMAVRQGHYETIDGWLDGLDRLTALRLCHSSGTTGKLSFFPRGAAEFEASRNIYRMNLAQWVDDETAQLWDYRFPVVHLAPRRGRSGMARSVKHIESMLVPPAVMHVLDDSELSVDLQHFLARTNAAMRQGTTVDMEATPYIISKMDEQRGRTGNLADDFRRLHETLTGPLAGQYSMVIGGTPIIWALAKAGLELGGRQVLEDGGGHMMTGGGLKGMQLAEDWEGDLRRYFGKTSVNQAYGMTEVVGGFAQCSAGRYHCPPWIVPFVLEREGGRPLPRSGSQRGRAAFFDLTARSHWGGIVTADILTISWEPCPCRRTTPHIAADVFRLLDGSDDGLTAAAPPEAVVAVAEGCMHA